MSDRLAKSDWLQHGLRVLARDGPGALKVVPLAAGLGVSRGSFYWHFRDIGDFRAELLAAWRRSSTDEVIEELDARQGEPGLLRRFAQRAFHGRRRLDRAVRAWAAEDPDVAKVVAMVDGQRIARLARLLVESGVAREPATHRAAFLYWAWLGQAAVLEARHASLPESALDDIAALFETRPKARSRRA
jgi:AcrR family transcriptional regulator